MRRTIFYTQTLILGQEANTSALSIFTSINITHNHSVLESTKALYVKRQIRRDLYTVVKPGLFIATVHMDVVQNARLLINNRYNN